MAAVIATERRWLTSRPGPEQIAGWLKRARPGDECYRVSHEAIYRSLFVQARGVLKKELLGHLRSIDDLRWRPTSTFTSAIRKVRGSAVPTRTPMVC